MEVPHELKEKYLQRRELDLKGCFQGLRQRDFSEIEKIGHRMKGNASTFGLPELTSIGRKLERAAALEDLAALEQAIDEFSSWMKQRTTNLS